jgi:hypothetical protein
MIPPQPRRITPGRPSEARSRGPVRVGSMMVFLVAVLLSQSVGLGATVPIPLLSAPVSSTQPNSQGENFQGAVEVLQAHQLESGLVTRRELRLAERWTEAVTSGGGEKAA